MNLHELFDGTQTLFLVGALALYIIDRLKKSDSNEKKSNELSERIEALDERLTDAMTRMANTVSSLAVSVGKLEGRLER